MLAIIRARDFEHALDVVNDTEFGLAGALFSADPDRIEQARRRFDVGNLYVSRTCTGAMTGAHPFGGFNMSGTDSKAGGMSARRSLIIPSCRRDQRARQ